MARAPGPPPRSGLPGRADRSPGRRLARLFVVLLGAVRLGAGVLEVASPTRFLGLLGAPPPGPGGELGFRMKGGRDVVLGSLAVAGARSDRALASAAAVAVVVDGIDGIAVLLDRGRTLAPPADRAGAALGLATAIVATWASRILKAGG